MGIGKALMLRVHEWLWSYGHDEIWLWLDPDPDIRAYGFYRKLGYAPTGATKGGDELLKLERKKS